MCLFRNVIRNRHRALQYHCSCPFLVLVLSNITSMALNIRKNSNESAFKIVYVHFLRFSFKIKAILRGCDEINNSNLFSLRLLASIMDQCDVMWHSIHMILVCLIDISKNENFAKKKFYLLPITRNLSS